jgi:hypothetical protein
MSWIPSSRNGELRFVTQQRVQIPDRLPPNTCQYEAIRKLGFDEDERVGAQKCRFALAQNWTQSPQLSKLHLFLFRIVTATLFVPPNQAIRMLREDEPKIRCS